MRMLIALPVYDVDEVCHKLAKLTGKPEKYSRQRINVLIKQKIKAPIKIGRQYLLTEARLSFLAKELQSPGRPKTIDVKL